MLATSPIRRSVSFSPTLLNITSLLSQRAVVRCRPSICLRSISYLSTSSLQQSKTIRMVLSFSTGLGSVLLGLNLVLVTVCPGCFFWMCKYNAGYDWKHFLFYSGQNSQGNKAMPTSLACLIVILFLLQSLFFLIDLLFASYSSFPLSSLISKKIQQNLSQASYICMLVLQKRKGDQCDGYQQISLIMTEQKSSKDTFPSLLLSAFSTISLKVSSSKFSLTWLFISLKSSIVRQFLLSLSYFLKIVAISFLVSLLKGFVSIAFMNSMKLMPPASSASNSATISQVVFRLGVKPFCVKSNLMSLGRRTPIPVESQASKTSFRSMTSWYVRVPVMQSSGWNERRSLRLNRTSYSLVLSILDSDLSGLQPNF